MTTSKFFKGSILTDISQIGSESITTTTYNPQSSDFLGQPEFSFLQNSLFSGVVVHCQDAFPEGKTILPNQILFYDADAFLFIASFERVDESNVHIYFKTPNGDTCDTQGQTINFEIETIVESNVIELKLKETDLLKVELPDVEYSNDEKQAIKDIQLILENSGWNKYIEIGLPDPRK